MAGLVEHALSLFHKLWPEQKPLQLHILNLAVGNFDDAADKPPKPGQVSEVGVEISIRVPVQ